MFKIGNQYKRTDVQRIIGIEEEKITNGGIWGTGYARNSLDWFLFINISVAGRTGHDYPNKYLDDEKQHLEWYGKTNTHINQQSIKQILNEKNLKYIFIREDSTSLFTFVGCGVVQEFFDTIPVKIIFRLTEVKSVEKTNFSEYVNNIYQDVIEDFRELEEIAVTERKEFVDRFPITGLSNLDITDFVLGQKDEEGNPAKTMQWHMEHHGKSFLTTILGSTKARVAHYNTSTGEFGFKEHVYGDSDEEKWNNVRSQLVKLESYAENNFYEFDDFNEDVALFRYDRVMKLKFLLYYHPQKLLSIGKEDAVAKLMKFFGLDHKPGKIIINNLNLKKYIMDNFSKTLNIETVSMMSRFLWGFYLDILMQRPQLIDHGKNTLKLKPKAKKITGAKNVIYYGPPGTGKSYRVNMEYNLENDFEIDRILFHPDYTYSDFIGTIIPKVGLKGIEYTFEPGPFVRILRKALANRDKKYALIVEEINRGNSSAIFGDIFQLLDRYDDGESEYKINNQQILDQLNDVPTPDNKISLPSNLWIIATANTSDQNTFVMDTAFIRRWDMEYCEINFSDLPIEKNFGLEESSEILKAKDWKEFAENINGFLLEHNNELLAEDKLLGQWFINKTQYDKKNFVDKILRYLWEDVVKYNKHILFDNEVQSLSGIRDIVYKGNGNLFSGKFLDFILLSNNES